MAKKKPTITVVVALNDKPALEGLKALTDKFLDFSKAIDPATRVAAIGLRAITTAIGVATAAMSASTAQAIEFDRALRSVSTIADQAAFPLERVRDLSYDLAGAYGTTVTDNARNLYEVISAGVSDAATAQEVLNTAHKLAIGGSASVASALQGLTSIVNSYGAETVSATRAADALTVAAADGSTKIEELASSLGMVTPIASAVGLSIEEVSSAVAVMSAGGIRTATGVEYLRSALTNIVKPSDQAAATAKQLGIEFSAEALAAKGLVRFLQDVVNNSGATQEQIARLFGDIGGLQAVTALAKNNVDGLTKSLERQAVGAGRTDTAFRIMSAGLGHQVDVFEALGDAGTTALGELVTASDGPAKALGVINGALEDVIGWLRDPATKKAFAEAFDTALYVTTTFARALTWLVEVFDDLTLAVRTVLVPLDLFQGDAEDVIGLVLDLKSRFTEGSEESEFARRLEELRRNLKAVATGADMVTLSVETMFEAMAPDLGLGAGAAYEPKYKPFAPKPRAVAPPAAPPETKAEREAREERERARAQDAEGMAWDDGKDGLGRVDALNFAIDDQNQHDAHNAQIESEAAYREELIAINDRYAQRMREIDEDVQKAQRAGQEGLQQYVDDLSGGLEGLVDLLNGDVSKGAATALQTIGDAVVSSFSSMIASVADGSKSVLDALGGFVGGIITQLGMMLIQLGTAAVLANALAVIPIFAGLVGPPGVGVAAGLAAIAAGAAMVGLGSAIGGAVSAGPGRGAGASAAGGGGGQGDGPDRLTSRPEVDERTSKRRGGAAFDDGGASGVPSRGVSSSSDEPREIKRETHIHFDRGVLVGSQAEVGRQVNQWTDAADRLRGRRDPWRGW